MVKLANGDRRGISALSIVICMLIFLDSTHFVIPEGYDRYNNPNMDKRVHKFFPSFWYFDWCF